MADDRAYRIQVLFDAENDGYRGLVPELEVEVSAPTRAEVVTAAEAAIEARIEAFAAEERRLPRPVDVDVPEAGEVTIALSGPIMRELAYHAGLNEVEPSALAEQLLVRAIGQLDGRRPPRKPRAEAQSQDEQPRQDDNRGGGGHKKRGGRGGGGRGRGGNRREGYRPEMDNQADFLAYVRNMEKGGGGGGGRR